VSVRSKLRGLFRPPATITDEARLERFVRAGMVEIGRWTYGTPRIAHIWGDTANIRIGSFCSIAEDVTIHFGGNHRTDWVSTFPFRSKFDLPGAYEDGMPATKGDVVIGNDVWMGRGATILSGVSIGDGAVVGAGAMVSKDVRPYAIVAGNPAREVKRRFPDGIVDRLLATRWWEWPDDRLRDLVPLLSSDDIEAFLAVAEGSVLDRDAAGVVDPREQHRSS
jgi:chloramphenicol O-acetyltransferase type B